MTVARSKSKTSEETSPSIIQEKLTGGEGDPCRQSVAQVLVALGVDGQLGLSTAEAAKRLKRYGRNELTAEKPVPAWRKFLAQFTDVLVILLLIAGLISAGLWLYERDSAFPYEATAIFAIVLLNGVMGYVQQARAEQALAALRKLSAAHAARPGWSGSSAALLACTSHVRRGSARPGCGRTARPSYCWIS